ncbi:MAG: rhomboid family intramembrane serine protease [Pelovirga sp.]
MDEKPVPEIEQQQWIAVPAQLQDGLSRRPLSKRQLRLWSLVLQARHIPCRTENSDGQRQLMVPAEHFHEALDELIAYEKENCNWPPPPPAHIPLKNNQITTFWVVISLIIFHNISTHQLQLLGSGGIDWLLAGHADVGHIRNGQWWRTITALTLHSGSLHLLSNLTIGGVLMLQLCRTLGSGLAFFLVLSAGILGNIINALLQSPDHRSIGASTAVFGALGLLAVYNMLRYRASLWRRWPLPLAAALGLLAILGVGDDNTDVGAHLFGFVSGAAMAYISLRLPIAFKVSSCRNLLWGAVAFVLIAGAWWLAIRNLPV